MDEKIVAVFGSSKPRFGDPQYATAYDVGRTIAELGLTLCNGGYGGVMEASARGAAEAGGHTIGVTCTRFARSGPNAYIRQEIPTFDLLQRLNTLIRLGRAFVVLPGGTGTLAELGLAWELLNKRLLGKNERPLIMFGEHWRPVVDCVLREQNPPVRPVSVDDIDALTALLRDKEW